jgi:hypothetical protein
MELKTHCDLRLTIDDLRLEEKEGEDARLTQSKIQNRKSKIGSVVHCHIDGLF